MTQMAADFPFAPSLGGSSAGLEALSAANPAKRDAALRRRVAPRHDKPQ
jgi:hypothetical protein